MRQLFPYTVCILISSLISKTIGFAIIMLGPPTINFAISTIICIVGDRENNLFAHYIMIYERVYGEIYDESQYTLTDSVYQALFSGLGTRLMYS